MSRSDSKFLKGYVTLSLHDARTGALKYSEVRNLVTTVGEQWVADRMLYAEGGALTGQTEMSWIELGLSALAPAAADTTLKDTFGGLGSNRKRYSTNERIGATWRLICNWGTTDVNTLGIVEAGIFSTSTTSAASEILLARTTFTAVNKTNADTLKIQWDINVSDDAV